MHIRFFLNFISTTPYKWFHKFDILMPIQMSRKFNSIEFNFISKSEFLVELFSHHQHLRIGKDKRRISSGSLSFLFRVENFSFYANHQFPVLFFYHDAFETIEKFPGFYFFYFVFFKKWKMYKKVWKTSENG